MTPDTNEEHVPWRIYERDRERDDRDRDQRRRELDRILAGLRQGLERVETKVDTVIDDLEAEDNQRTGKVAVGRAIWVYVAGGALLLISIASGIVSIVVTLRGGR